MKYTVVLPFVYQKYMVKCMNTVKLDNVFLVDNTVNNIGIMKSHNLGIDKMFKDKSDWLIILSAAIRFGKPGGLDFIEELKKRPDDAVVEADNVFGWHLIAFNKQTIEAVGRWDENFTPYGYDDLDYAWRTRLMLKKTQQYPIWEKVFVDIKDMGMAHSLKFGKIKTQKDSELREYFVKKWGDVPIPIYTHPFNNEKNSIKYFPKYG